MHKKASFVSQESDQELQEQDSGKNLRKKESCKN